MLQVVKNRDQRCILKNDNHQITVSFNGNGTKGRWVNAPPSQYQKPSDERFFPAAKNNLF